MAFVGISNTVTQYAASATALAGGYYLKGYAAGTTTPLSMATDSTGGTTLAKCKLSQLGNPLSNPSDEESVFIPHFNATYKLVLFTNATDADNNTLANAVWEVDNIEGLFDASSIDYDGNATVTQKLNNLDVDDYTALRALTVAQLADNDSINVAYRTTEFDGGGGVFVWSTTDLSTEVTADPSSGVYVAPNSDSSGTSGAFVRADIDIISGGNVLWYGAVRDTGRTTDSTAAIQAAINANIRVFFPTGDYVISDTLTKDADSFKMFGEAEGDNGSRIIPAVTWLGSTTDSDGFFIFLSLGNGSTSRHFNEIHHLTFDDPDRSSAYNALYFDRVNNQSKIFNCEFMRLARGFELINLSLACTICYNKFDKMDDHFRLTGAAGNSSQITHNYFSSGGRSYFNDSMTGINFTHNTCDGEYTMFTDGTAGLRGCEVSFNRFEAESITGAVLDFGVSRGVKVTHNYFQGQGTCDIAIQFRSSGARETAEIHDNYFELFTVSYVNSNLQDNALILYGNQSDNGLAQPTTPFDTNKVSAALPLEGFWTPVVQDSSANSATASTAIGAYSLSGNFCTVICQLNGVNKTGLTAGDAVRITGLPFTSSNDAADPTTYMSTVPRLQDVTFVNTPSAFLVNNRTYCTLVDITPSASDVDILVSDVTNGAEIQFTLTYKI